MTSFEDRVPEGTKLDSRRQQNREFTQARKPAKLVDRLAAPRRGERIIRSFFGDRSVYSGDAAVFPHPLYLVGFSNRTGSNLLAEYLRSTGAFGGFREQLNHDAVLNLSKTIGADSFPDYLEKVSAKFGDKSIYGFKASWSQISMLLRCRIDRMYTGVKVIHLTRADALAQAVSYSIAQQTNRWTSVQKGEVAASEFDFNDISMRLDANLFSANAIAMICSLFMIPRIHICYEELTEDPHAVMLKIGKFCELDFRCWQPEKPLLTKQANTINAEYALRFADTARNLIVSGIRRAK